MYSMPSDYADNVQSLDRRMSVYISIGTGVDQTAADDLTEVTGEFLPMSNTSQVIDAVYKMTTGMTTFEGDGIPTSADNGLVAPPIAPMDYPPELGVWSNVISDENGNIDFTMTLNLSAAHTSALRIYTVGPNVTSAEVTFVNGDESETATCDCYKGYFDVVNSHTYTTIIVHVTGIDRPFCHLRVVEVEFGSAITFSGTNLGGEIVTIAEVDPLETSIPLYELDLSVINVDGSFDEDNPMTRLSEVAIGYPLDMAYSLELGEDMLTVPCGKFYIAERQSSDTRLNLAAFDGRWVLSESYAEWSISTSKSFGETFDDLLQEYGIPHIVEEDLFSKYPDADHTFSSDSSVLDDLLCIQQAYAVYMVPDRDQVMRVTSIWPAGDAGSVNIDTIYSWPTASQTSRYNVVVVPWVDSAGKMHSVSRDLRTDSREPKNPLSIADNLLLDETKANALLTRIISRMTSSTVESLWMGDPAMDMGDTLSIPGRWTTDTPKTYRLDYQELTFDGALTARIRGSR